MAPLYDISLYLIREDIYARYSSQSIIKLRIFGLSTTKKTNNLVIHYTKIDGLFGRSGFSRLYLPDDTTY